MISPTEQRCEQMLLQWQKYFAKTDTISAHDLINYLRIHNAEVEARISRLAHEAHARLQAEQKAYQEGMDTWLDDALEKVFLDLQNLAVLLEKANNGELPPAGEITEISRRLAALEKTVAGFQARSARY